MHGTCCDAKMEVVPPTSARSSGQAFMSQNDVADTRSNGSATTHRAVRREDGAAEDEWRPRFDGGRIGGRGTACWSVRSLGA